MDWDDRYEQLTKYKAKFDKYSFYFKLKEILTDKPDLLRNKTILNLQGGSGWIALYCALVGGASKVYTVENSEAMVQIIKGCSVENGVKDKVQVLKGNVKDIVIPEPVDGIIFDWTTFSVFNDSFHEDIIAARSYMKNGGFIIPESCEIYAGLCQLTTCIDFLNAKGITMKSVEQIYRDKCSNKLFNTGVKSKRFNSNVQKLVEINFYNSTKDELDSVKHELLFVANDSGIVDGISIWCSFGLSGVTNKPLENTDINPSWADSSETSIIFSNQLEVEKDEPVCFDLTFVKENAGNYKIKLENIEPDEIEHPVGCNCYMTKCMVLSACLSNPAFNYDDSD
ncbi:protein arginine N-methyltransferase 2-like [Cimex lectularius]|uniref:Uncharacterized protein n=1 Tax=Cimex lectularius TaxID=79782 RepID=A0A8I6S9F8_CIMLE|nr:protein arginine N-methyltransferase 2-like [Cimex lectularius]